MFKNIKFIFIMVLVSFSLTLSACETLQGAGRDLENAGKTIQRTLD